MDCQMYERLEFENNCLVTTSQLGMWQQVARTVLLGHPVSRYKHSNQLSRVIFEKL